jgi:hypothetical protein
VKTVRASEVNASHRCPEAFLSNEEFAQIAKLDKRAFYRADCAQQKTIREKLFPRA